VVLEVEWRQQKDSLLEERDFNRANG